MGLEEPGNRKKTPDRAVFSLGSPGISDNVLQEQNFLLLWPKNNIEISARAARATLKH